MEKSNKKSLFWYALLLVLSFCGQIFPGLMDLRWGCGPATFCWLFTMLLVCCIYRTKSERLLTGSVFILGFIIRYYGSFESALVNIGVFLIFGLIWYGIFLITAYVMNRWNHSILTLFFPCLWSILYLAVTLLRFPSVARFDMMFVSMKVLILAERVLGSYGLSFFILWVISLLTFAICRRRKIAAIVAAVITLVLFSIGFFFYVGRHDEKLDTIPVAYTMGPYCGSFTNYVDIPYEENVACMQKAVKEAAAQGAKILAFSEEAFSMEETQMWDFLGLCQEAASENNIVLLVGLDISDTDNSDDGKSKNLLVCIDQNGEILGDYLKTKLIPLIESDYLPGDGTIPSHTLDIDGKSVTISYLICYDSNFPQYVKQIDSETDLLILPSWDWKPVTQLHSMICRTIAIENHVSVLKPTYDGKSVAINPNGKVIYRSYTSRSGYEAIHIVDMPVKADN